MTLPWKLTERDQPQCPRRRSPEPAPNHRAPAAIDFQMTMKTTLDDEADPPMVVVFTPLEGNASASHMIDKSRHLSDGNSLAPVSVTEARAARSSGGSALGSVLGYFASIFHPARRHPLTSVRAA